MEIDLRIISEQTSPTFVFQVIKTGECLYQRNNQDKVRFEARVLSQYYDGEHVRRIYDSYLKVYWTQGFGQSNKVKLECD